MPEPAHYAKLGKSRLPILSVPPAQQVLFQYVQTLLHHVFSVRLEHTQQRLARRCAPTVLLEHLLTRLQPLLAPSAQLARLELTPAQHAVARLLALVARVRLAVSQGSIVADALQRLLEAAFHVVLAQVGIGALHVEAHLLVCVRHVPPVGLGITGPLHVEAQIEARAPPV